MLCQSPRLLHAAALRETLHTMSLRLGHVEGVCYGLCPQLRSKADHRKQLLQPDTRRTRTRPDSQTCAGMSCVTRYYPCKALQPISPHLALTRQIAQGLFARRLCKVIMRLAQRSLSRSREGISN